MSVVIRVEHLGKKYTIAHQQREQYTALRDVIANSFNGFGKRIANMFGGSPDPKSQSELSEEFWALKDVSFEVNQGDRIGIIGRNGAGKSTLLKILSRITEPTTGSIKIKGRVASLLEVGTGFHPELTGRENIFLNGAILGMGRAEIRKKFDEIVDFAEIEKFLDTPVKRYSSGMYVRLAFAVAAHLEPEILVVDEVLAVGDAQFQKKCLGKMGDVSIKEGRTVLFVSHNMDSIVNLCLHAHYIEDGRIINSGKAGDVVECYLMSSKETGGLVRYNERKDVSLSFISASVSQNSEGDSNIIYADKPFQIVLYYRVSKPMSNVQVVAHIFSHRGLHVLSTSDIDVLAKTPHREIGNYKACITIPAPLLGSGHYSIQLACGIPDVELIEMQDGPSFEIRSEGTPFGLWSSGRRGTLLNFIIPWQTTKICSESKL